MDTAQQYNIPEPLRLTPEAEQVVMSYKWPGNIRQLKNVVEQMSILCKDRTVTPDTLAEYGITPSSDRTDLAIRPASIAAKENESMEQALKMMQLMIQSLKTDVEMMKQKMAGQESGMHIVRQLPAPPVQIDSRPIPATAIDVAEDIEMGDDEDLNLEKNERRLIEKALRRSRNRRKVAADDLGISERTLYRKIRDYGIEE